MTNLPDIVPVALPDNAYDIVVGHGLLADLGKEVARVTKARRIAIVSDRTVARHYLTPVRAALESAGFATHVSLIEPGETSKSFPVLETLADELLEAGIERGDAVLALGGGVVGDLAGFAASILRRGVTLIQCPTTLLAQVDSSVGGKTGIDTRQGKNLIGSFHQPARVLIDIATLDTLPARELRAGYAEIVKYGLIDDAPFFAWLEENGARLLGGDTEARRHAIVTSCMAKAHVVVADEREQGLRALLNLGHTFGHALEAITGFGPSLLHGEAIAIGLGLAFDLSVELGLAPPADAARLRAHLATSGLPTAASDIPGAPFPLDEVMSHLAQDKKMAQGRVTFVLARGIGRAFLSREVSLERARAFLARAPGLRP